MSCNFNPEDVLQRVRTGFPWVNTIGEITQPPTHIPLAEDVANGEYFDFSQLYFTFLAGSLNLCYEQWRNINASPDVLGWLRAAVDINNMFKHFKGNFKGTNYNSLNSDIPPTCYFPNAHN